MEKERAMQALISYHYRKNFADFSMDRMHTHEPDNFEIMYVKEGHCTVKTPDGEHSLSAGSFILLGNGCPHSLEARNAAILNVEFYVNREGVDVSDVLAAYPEILKLFSERAVDAHDKSEVFSALSALITELKSEGNGLCAELLFKRLLIELARSCSLKKNRSVKYVNTAIEYIEQHFCEPITAEEIANEIGLNRSYLQTLFKSHTGKTVLEYINSLRIAKACFIMKNTDLSVVDIAVDCGFASRQHFMYTFKKHTGMTAKQFRGGTKDYETE